MSTIAKRAKALGGIALEGAAEVLWPTRCAVCDVPGAVLCDRCRRDLPYVDWWRACPRCGAPFGRCECTECNPVMLEEMGRDGLPFASCASAVAYRDAATLVVRAYKDQGERRLAVEIARIMARVLHPAWIAERPIVVGVPATARAVRQRGFDHMEPVARELARIVELEAAQPLARPRSRDQRGLARRARQENMKGRFAVLPGADVPPHVLLVDDVYTTGATLCAASDALLTAGAQTVRCLTFARVW